MNQNIDYHSKYLKYKIKYLNLKSELDGGSKAGSMKAKAEAKAAWKEKNTPEAKAERKREKEEAMEMKRAQKADAKDKKQYRQAIKIFDEKVKEIENNPRGWKSRKEKEKFEKAWGVIKDHDRFDGEEGERKKKYLKILEIVKINSKKK